MRQHSGTGTKGNRCDVNPDRHPPEPAGLRATAAAGTAAYGNDLPPASRQWNFAIDDGDLFKGGFGG
jgi:hypothetical protein